MPDSAPTIVNYDLPRRTVNAAFCEGVDPSFAASYLDHYASINPWLAFWSAVPPGEIVISERDSPSSAFRDSEFYTDWLGRQEQLKAATGLRIDVDRSNTILVGWHYSPARASVYDRFTEHILLRIRDGLVEAVRNAALLRHGLERSRRLGPLIERIEAPALMIDAERRIREANAEAAVAMVRGDIFTGPGDILTLRDPAAQRWLEETVLRLLPGGGPSSARTTFVVDGEIFRVVVTRAPEFDGSGSPLLVRPRPQVLVVVRPLVGVALHLDAPGLGLAFGLTAVETRLCEILVNGHSLAEAAGMLRLSEGTVRQRAKVIFQKTGTHRQGQLIALVCRFVAEG